MVGIQAECLGVVRGSALQVSFQGARRRLPREVPDHGAQLGLDVEREAVVDHPDAPLGVGEAVS